MLSNENYRYDSFRLGDVEVIHFCRTEFDFTVLARKFDGLIIGGGALLDDTTFETTWRGFVSLSTIVAKLPLYFHARNKPVLCIGLSCNAQLHNKKFSSYIAEVSAKSEHFSVRDEYSLRKLDEIGVNSCDIKLVDDIVLSNSIWLKERVLSHKPKKTGVFSVALTWTTFVEDCDNRLLLVIRSISNVVHEMGMRLDLCLIPFFNSAESDSQYFLKIIKMFPTLDSNNIVVANYPNTIEDVANIFDNVDYAINMRYHASLICGALGIPQLILAPLGHRHYKNKMEWVGRQFSKSLILMDVAEIADGVDDKFKEVVKMSRGAGISHERVKNNIANLKEVINNLREKSK